MRFEHRSCDHEHDQSHRRNCGREVYAYRRTGEACRVCSTEISKRTHASRNLFWCARCQAAT